MVILSIDRSTGIARGSARSIPGFDIHGGLSMCAELLIKWGGHKAAAGLTIAAERIGEFTERFEEVARQYPAKIFVQRGKVDLVLPLDLVGYKLVQALGEFEAHGMGNPAPVFAMRGVRFNSVKVFGKDKKHLKLQLKNGLEQSGGVGRNAFPHWRTIKKFAPIFSGANSGYGFPRRLG